MVVINNINKNVDDKKTKTTKGRQKIEIKKLEDKNSLQVTFSKRRYGLFNKAMELSVLCGAKVGIIVFSPNRKMFVIGHPDFDTVLNWYLNGESPPPEVSASIPCLQEHNKQYEKAMRELEKEKRKGKAIEEEKKAEKNNNNNGGFWWDESIDKMRLEELEEYVKGLMKLRSIVASRISDMLMTNHYLKPPAAATMAAVATGLDVLPINNNGLVVDGNSNSVCGFDDRFTEHLRM
ncbi:hypothetical protein LWI29_005396 [Acer saccharum]|uniref:MADS-box domain-containing protein n=1 Tax=Acer saccharum TaxID=4024 RepID=A0AA39RUX9_ACESA|nr:hypothetical protein LWI29_005396 [Acer saccharum]